MASTFYLDYELGNDATTNTPLGWWSVAFTGGTTAAPSAGDTVTGGSSGSTAKMTAVVLSGGSWAGNDAAGTMYFYGKSAAFQSEEVTWTGGHMDIGGDFTYCAWKTITSGATAARIAPGDVIRIAKSPAPTSIGNATWTSLSKTVTLASSQTLTVDNCETKWTENGSGDCTCSAIAVATDAKQGSYCMKFLMDAAVQTGTMQAYYKISDAGIDFSAYQKLSFWIKNEAAIADGESWYVCLCSDVAGATVVDTFKVPAIPSTASWLPLTLTKVGGGNLGSAIKSVAVWTGTTAPTASKYIYIDNIIACTTNGLNLQSLISKNTLEQSTISATGYGNEAWYGIQSIDGVTVLLDNATSTKANDGRGYYTSGTSPETITTYKRETLKPLIHAGLWDSTLNYVIDSGTSGNYIEFQGGYDTGTNQQTGDTLLDGLNGYGRGFYCYLGNYIKINWLGFFRFYVGISTEGRKLITFENISNLNNNNFGIYTNKGDTKFTITNILNANNNAQYGLYFHNESSNSNNFNIINIGAANNNLLEGIRHNGSNFLFQNIGQLCNNKNYGLSINSGLLSTFNKISEIKNNNYGIFFQGEFNKLYDITTSNNVTGSLFIAGSNNYILKASIGESAICTFYSGSYNMYNIKAYVNNISGYSYIHCGYGLIISQDTIRHTASGVAWQLSPTNAERDVNYPLELSIAKIAVASSSEVTVKAWVKLSHASDIGAKLICKGGQISGVATDVTDTKTADTDWEELSISFTPTEAGVIEILAQAYYLSGVADESVYIDDITVTQV